MAFVDYVIKHTDNMEALADRILYSTFIKRIKGNKPVNVLLTGGSGEGKSVSNVTLQAKLLALQGVEMSPEILEVMNIFTPNEYGEKMNKVLYDKRYKKVNVVAIHEARDIVSANNWQDFLAKAVASINQQSRKIKPLIVFVISQHISDIARSTRVTCQYHIEARRSIGKHTKYYVNTIWERKHGLEKSELMPRRLSGFLVDEHGRYRRHYLECLEMTLPAKEYLDLFDRLDTESKSVILASKMGEVMRRIKQETGDYGNKINAMVDWYTKDESKIPTIGKQFRGRWKVKSEIIKAHDLSPEESRQFETKLTERLNTMGYFAKPEPEAAE